MKKRNLAIAIGGGIGAAVAVKMFTRAKTVEWDNVADQVVHSEHSHFVNVDGVRVHYQEFGEASKWEPSPGSRHHMSLHARIHPAAA